MSAIERIKELESIQTDVVAVRKRIASMIADRRDAGDVEATQALIEAGRRCLETSAALSTTKLVIS